MFRFRRPVVLAAAMTAVLLALAGCGGSSSGAEADTEAASGEQFPVTLEHVYGETTITAKPTRIVTIGWMTQDIVAALGTAPVLVPTTWGGDDEGFTPWFRTQVEDVLQADMPEILTYEDDPDYEQILAAAPDVILAPHSGITETQYKRLSEIAPTVAYAEKPWVSGSWEDLTEVVATAMGEQDKAAELITQTQSAIDTEAAKYDNLKGASFLYGLSLSEGATEFGVYVSADPRVAFLREFGLVDSPDLADALGTIDDEAFYGALSLENLNDIDTDIVVGWSGSDEETEYTLEHATFSRWTPIKNGNYLFMADTTLGMATSGPNVLSIPWAIGQGFVEDLSQAIDGDAVTVSEKG